MCHQLFVTSSRQTHFLPSSLGYKYRTVNRETTRLSVPHTCTLNTYAALLRTARCEGACQERENRPHDETSPDEEADNAQTRHGSPRPQHELTVSSQSGPKYRSTGDERHEREDERDNHRRGDGRPTQRDTQLREHKSTTANVQEPDRAAEPAEEALRSRRARSTPPEEECEAGDQDPDKRRQDEAQGLL